MNEILFSPCYDLVDLLIWGALCALMVFDLTYKKEGDH